jgi:predicted O-linked N-acetylglucosamine transferase (SPINDLY family)
MPLFDFVDRTRFELFCYSWSRNEPDPVQKYLTGRVDAFRWHKAIADRDAAQLIANDQLDMLFELGSSTDMNKLEVMAYKPAPIQASWLGYPHSAGLETIDRILVDPFINPPDPKLLIEKPFLMPHSWVAMGRLGFNEAEAINPVLPSERNGYVTYGTANNPYKYSPKVLETWARITAATENARFMFVRPESGTPAFREAMTKAFAAEGVPAERIVFTAVRGPHMRWYNEMDISLDTFPQTGGTTTCESLFMGVPVISLVGPAFFERLSYSNLSNAGLGDLATFSIEDYVAKTLSLADDTARRLDLRRGLRADLKQRPLGRQDLFASDFYTMVEKTVKEGA